MFVTFNDHPLAFAYACCVVVETTSDTKSQRDDTL